MTTTKMDSPAAKIEWSKMIYLLIGVALFFIVYYSPPWSDAIDPEGKHFILSKEAKGAIAVFLLGGTWWIFEVVPIGVTSLAMGILQSMFFIRPAKTAFQQMFDPSVVFIFGSLVIGIVFTKTGLTRRLAYKMLSIVGEKTSMIYLGCFVVTAALTHIMAHTAVAATMYPLLITIYSLYTDDETTPTRFGKGLFIGMAYVAGAGSIVTLLGAARGAVALGFYKELVGSDISFFQYTYYLFPIGWIMTFVLWGFFMVFFKPERSTIPGLKEKATKLSKGMGGFTKKEIFAAAVIFSCIAVLSIKRYVPALAPIDKSAILLTTTVLFFIVRILDIKDLESIPWNIILLFGGAMSIGFCLWETGAAEWMAVKYLSLFKDANWFIFVMSMAFLLMIMTNFIMNVAAVAIVLPVALVIGKYLGVGPDVITFSSLVVSGMPFLLLVGAAPNAIAYDSKQFTTGEFFGYGIPASILLMIVTGLAVYIIWPIMGMQILIN
ncbi:MAG: SLC13/DASS family transporter [Desulfobacteraceae bacterium]|nr:SLC13/DASS family transporter [Desulfobacteraceae bacterium]